MVMHKSLKDFVGTLPTVGLGLVVQYLEYSIYYNSRVDYSHRSPITVGDREEEMCES